MMLNARRSKSKSKEHKFIPPSQYGGALSLCGAKAGYLLFDDYIPEMYSLYDETNRRWNFIAAVIFDHIKEIDDNIRNIVPQNVFNLIARSYTEPDSKTDRIFFSTLNLDIDKVLNRIERRHNEEVLN